MKRRLPDSPTPTNATRWPSGDTTGSDPSVIPCGSDQVNCVVFLVGGAMEPAPTIHTAKAANAVMAETT